VFVSARHDEGLDALRDRIEQFFFGRNLRVEVKISAGDGENIARIHRLLRQVSEAYDGDVCILRGTIEGDRMGRLDSVHGAEIRYLF
jgi:50S ribosomal subunit-associated GTPase HflX